MTTLMHLKKKETEINFSSRAVKVNLLFFQNSVFTVGPMCNMLPTHTYCKTQSNSRSSLTQRCRPIGGEQHNQRTVLQACQSAIRSFFGVYVAGNSIPVSFLNMIFMEGYTVGLNRKYLSIGMCACRCVYARAGVCAQLLTHFIVRDATIVQGC